MVKSLEKLKDGLTNDVSCIDNWFAECLSVQDFLNETIRLFKDVNIELPRLDAELLLANAIGCNTKGLYIDHNLELEEQTKIYFTEMVRKRLRRVPTQYILGHAEFMSLDFIVNEDVLIPRHETELIVESVLRIANNEFDRDDVDIAHKRFASSQSEKYLTSSNKQKSTHINIIDLCTGSGNIGVSIAVLLKCAKVYASDISSDALKVARLNAKRHKVDDKTIFLQGNIFDPFKAKGIALKADFVVSNPPYVAENELDTLQPEVIKYEPYQALVGGDNGFGFFRMIIAEVKNWIKDGGYLILEIGDKQLDRVMEFINAYQSGLRFLNTEKDLQGIDRIIIAQKT